MAPAYLAGAVTVSGFLKHVIQLTAGELVHLSGHLHTNLDLVFRNIIGDTAEYLVIAVIQQGDGIGKVIAESNRREYS